MITHTLTTDRQPLSRRDKNPHPRKRATADPRLISRGHGIGTSVFGVEGNVVTLQAYHKAGPQALRYNRNTAWFLLQNPETVTTKKQPVSLR